jgi:hypothetical protein
MSGYPHPVIAREDRPYRAGSVFLETVVAELG